MTYKPTKQLGSEPCKCNPGRRACVCEREVVPMYGGYWWLSLACAVCALALAVVVVGSEMR